ncbi:RGG repeats nuclear RNA binding protein A [Sesamum angolense]|uniref:RGG repeats nuclear RNA binding protein A n=1 Tax=Sesamum angolense TaxID=2727404 RepID=A0AAE2C6S9_9LAMI|nr:RGG repeats nuclear RNA binding protein A [Sesamum angolense]
MRNFWRRKERLCWLFKTEERKVDVKEFEYMQPLANKKTNDDVFIKLGSDKDKKKELAEKEERAKKSVSINEFLKPAEGEAYYNRGGRGRGRGRGSRGGYTGGSKMGNAEAPAIEDPGQFPTLEMIASLLPFSTMGDIIEYFACYSFGVRNNKHSYIETFERKFRLA